MSSSPSSKKQKLNSSTATLGSIITSSSGHLLQFLSINRIFALRLVNKELHVAISEQKIENLGKILLPYLNRPNFSGFLKHFKMQLQYEKHRQKPIQNHRIEYLLAIFNNGEYVVDLLNKVQLEKTKIWEKHINSLDVTIGFHSARHPRMLFDEEKVIARTVYSLPDKKLDDDFDIVIEMPNRCVIEPKSLLGNGYWSFNISVDVLGQIDFAMKRGTFGPELKRENIQDSIDLAKQAFWLNDEYIDQMKYYGFA